MITLPLEWPKAEVKKSRPTTRRMMGAPVVKDVVGGLHSLRRRLRLTAWIHPPPQPRDDC